MSDMDDDLDELQMPGWAGAQSNNGNSGLLDTSFVSTSNSPNLYAAKEFSTEDFEDDDEADEMINAAMMENSVKADTSYEPIDDLDDQTHDIPDGDTEDIADVINAIQDGMEGKAQMMKEGEAKRQELKNTIRKHRKAQIQQGMMNKKKGSYSYLMYFAVGAFVLQFVISNFIGGGSSANDNALMTGKYRSRKLPVCTGSTIVVTDAAFGVARETALLLADQGFYVLAGVRNSIEQKSFVYETKKGLETIIMNPTDPNDIAKVLYRTKEIKAHLGRPLYGMIVNTADSVLHLEYLHELNKKSKGDDSNKKDNKVVKDRKKLSVEDIMREMEEKEATKTKAKEDGDVVAAAKFLNFAALDESYKTVVKGPMRVVQAALEIFEGAYLDWTSKLAESNMKIEGQICESDEHGEEVCKSANPIKAVPNGVFSSSIGKKTRKGSALKSDEDEAMACKMGATARFLFLNYDFQGVKGLDPAMEKAAQSSFVSGFFAAKKKKKRRLGKTSRARAKKLKARYESGYSEDDVNIMSLRDLNEFFFPNGCGVMCSTIAALSSYIDQFRDLMHGESRSGQYYVGSMDIPSKPYRYKNKKVVSKNSKHNLPDSFWELDLSHRTTDKASKVVSGKNATTATRTKSIPKNIIDPNFSKEANYAAHAMMNAYPKPIYSLK